MRNIITTTDTRKATTQPTMSGYKLGTCKRKAERNYLQERHADHDRHGAIFAVFTEVIACQARSGVEIDEHRNRTVSDDLGKAVICAVVVA